LTKTTDRVSSSRAWGVFVGYLASAEAMVEIQVQMVADGKNQFDLAALGLDVPAGPAHLALADAVVVLTVVDGVDF
jgi:hypothetical protein